ncbi:lytic transglycosylase domain-containing protein [Roseomonas stagni]|uniref:Lytic transglycosylase domain-containing protein n=1 Tax=Falsiroseomonas algicola TaxID=2716930 RepID=A0A6M1LPS5_9PROT|nr:transglycosylase SLT domain-containing protein [Falsiroseomonas algicola]NGM21784.1 lytic transglycosylase domain-containing protein [Falsiroseomonas algicola]
MSPEVLHALQSVAASPSERVLLFALASRESRFVATARNPASSARGLMQFTRTTWLEAVRDHGPAHGLAFHADALSTDPETGTISARDSRLLEELLVLRDDPNLSAAFAMARLGLEKENLAPVLRRPVTDADLYLVHFLGPVGARRFLRELARAPSQRASDVVGPDAVAANRNVFVARNGRHRSLGQVHAAVRQDLWRQRAVYAGLMGGAGPGRAEVAEAR